MRHLAATEDHLVRTVGAEDQDTAVTRLTAEMKQQAAGGLIDPVQVFCCAILAPASALVSVTSSLNQGALRWAKVAARSRTPVLGTKVPSRSGAWSMSAGSVSGMASHKRRACSVPINPPAHRVSTSPESIVNASRNGKYGSPLPVWALH